MTTIGIHDLELATGHYVMDLAALATARGMDPAKFTVGLGQDQMSVPAPDEDAVTMGAAAALGLIQRHGTDGIRTLLFATESGVDESKSAAVFAHRLLGLPSSVRAVELKQACYGGAAALQAALGIVSRHPDERVLVIASDVARYALGTPGEPTQGAGAVAMLVSADPAFLAIEPGSGVYTSEVDDFWRPIGSPTALVDGRLSLTAYLDALQGAWDDLTARGGTPESLWRIAYHQPFTKMAVKAQRRLVESRGLSLGEQGLQTSSIYNRRIGNTYTASLFFALAALRDHEEAIAGQRIGLFSYGSGSVGELFTGVVQPDAMPDGEGFLADLERRTPLGVSEYEQLHAATHLSDADIEVPAVTAGPFRFAGVRAHARRYEAVSTP